MTKTSILIIGIFVLTGCKESIEKFVFNSSRVSTFTKYYYEYDSKKLISSKEITYTLMHSHILDSMILITDYKYNGKGLIIKKISKLEYQKKPTLRLFEYNSNDLLIRTLTIEPENDTTTWDEYIYYPDGRKTVFHRDLFIHLDPDEDYTEPLENQQFDTTLYKTDYEYINGICHSLKRFDQNENLIKKIKYEFNNNQLHKEIHISYFDSIELIEKIKYYDYSKSESQPDFYSLDLENDTIELRINEFTNNTLLTKTEIFEYGNMVNKLFFENELIIGLVGIDKEMNFKIVDSYEYYANGDLKETKRYNE